MTSRSTDLSRRPTLQTPPRTLMDLLTGLINAGSVILSVELPNATGSYAPGSLGSYGPEASIGDVLTIPVASLGGAS